MWRIENIFLICQFSLGLLYDHGHLARAMCCRLARGDPDINSLLSNPFHLNHPWLGRVTVCDVPRETQKTKALSVNWCFGDAEPEVTDGTLGLCCTRYRMISDQRPVQQSGCFWLLAKMSYTPESNDQENLQAPILLNRVLFFICSFYFCLLTLTRELFLHYDIFFYLFWNRTISLISPWESSASLCNHSLKTIPIN